MSGKNKLTEIRMKEYQMSPTEFCQNVLHISRSTYSQLENSKTIGNIETALKIAKALNRTIEDIWFIED